MDKFKIAVNFCNTDTVTLYTEKDFLDMVVQAHNEFSLKPIKEITVEDAIKYLKELNNNVFFIENADVQTEDIVKVTCYGRTETMTRADAIAKYHECIFCSEGAERDRYVEIYGQLLNGDKHATDEPYRVVRY